MRDLALLVGLGMLGAWLCLALAHQVAVASLERVAVGRCVEAWDDQREILPHVECHRAVDAADASPSPRRTQGQH